MKKREKGNFYCEKDREIIYFTVERKVNLSKLRATLKIRRNNEKKIYEKKTRIKNYLENN